MKTLIQENQKHDLQPAALVEKAITLGQGKLSSTGALGCQNRLIHGALPKRPFHRKRC